MYTNKCFLVTSVDITKKVFEYGSRWLSQDLILHSEKAGSFKKGNCYTVFLNSLGYSFDNFEAIYHLDEFISRMLILNKKQAIDAILQEKIKSTFDKRLNELKDKKLEII